MAASRLQIKLLSSSGELLNVVNAPNGRLTVLRAFVPSQLEPYRRAVSGVPGPERITVSLNGNEFSPDEHILIGFGEQARAVAPSATDLLLQSGINRNAIPGILMSYGLTEVATKPFSQITDCQRQRCLLLAALQQTTKVVVLNNPFEPLSSEWREQFAQLLLNYVRSNPMPVLVISMTYRPECFINNELINRIQVGENDQRTIGFGSEPSEYDSLIKQIRKDQPEVKRERPPSQRPKPKKPSESSQNAATRKSSRDIPVKRQSRSTPKSYGVTRLMRHRAIRKGFLAFLVGALLLTFAIQAKNSDKKGVREVAATRNLPTNTTPKEDAQKSFPPAESNRLKLKKNSPAETGENNSPPETPEIQKVTRIEPSQPVAVEKPIPVTPPEESEEVVKAVQKEKSPFMLDMYQASVKQSILASFEGAESARAANLQLSGLQAQRKKDREGASPREKQVDAFTKSLLTDLQKTDGTGEGLPDRETPTYSSNSPVYQNRTSSPASGGTDFKDMSKEERRALLREKFRLAIERAAQKK